MNSNAVEIQSQSYSVNVDEFSPVEPKPAQSKEAHRRSPSKDYSHRPQNTLTDSSSNSELVEIATDDRNTSQIRTRSSLNSEIDQEVPDSGWQAWLVVVGAFCANVTTAGLMNSSSTIQEYLLTHILKGKSESTVAWVFSLYIFLPGCILWCTSLFIMSACTEYYQFILAFSILGGISSSLIYNPSYTVISQWFTTKRPVASGFVALGSSVTGSFLPIVLSTLFEKVGYGWTMRILAFMFVGLSVIACLTMKSRNRTPGNIKWKDVSIDFKSLRSPSFSWSVGGLLISEWAFFLPSWYIVDFAKTLIYTARDSNLLLVYLNIGSTFGRLGGGYASRFYGPFNSMIVATALAGLSSLCVWLPVGHSRVGLTAFAVVFGTFRGAGMSVGPTCKASISNSLNFGRRYGTTYGLISVAVLTSLPIGGVMATGSYSSMKIVSGVAYLASSWAWALAKWYSYGNKLIA